MKEISLFDIGNVRIGNAQDKEHGTGCTVLICPDGVPCGVDIRGGGPASRESALLDPRAAAERFHAVLLSGGSAYGLNAAGGVMAYLEEHGIGFDTVVCKVPLVLASCIYDLGCGANVRPDAAMGYAACVAAETNNAREGNEGAGTGATVGKCCGSAYRMKSGLGMYAVETNGLKVGAIVAVNALGDVINEDGTILAGMRHESGKGLPIPGGYCWKNMENETRCFLNGIVRLWRRIRLLAPSLRMLYLIRRNWERLRLWLQMVWSVPSVLSIRQLMAILFMHSA